MSSCQSLSAYYRSAEVRARIAEYCGGRPEAPEAFSSWNIAGYGGEHTLHEPDGAPISAPNAEFGALLEQGADLCRSLADREGALLQLDVDYVNLRDTGDPYRDPASCFARMEPVHDAVLEVFGRYGIRPLTLVTGRGYHFTLRAPRGSPFHSDLLDLGSPPLSLSRRYASFAPAGQGAAMGKAHDGAGRLLEHLAHEVARGVRGRAPIPVTVADVAPPGGGPFICLDLTAYADPLFARYARCAFSGNQKAWVTGVAPDKPFVIVLPRTGSDSMDEILRDREQPDQAGLRARRAEARIPDVPRAPAWVEDYRRGPLARFHREFDAGPEVPREAWPHTYDSLDLRTLPACVRTALASPNPSLLVPVHLRTVALALWGMGWHPRSAAALVRSRYEKDLGWGDLWSRYDATARSEYYVRVFCGAVADGLEDPWAFTCGSQAARGVCPGQGCGWDLARLLPPELRARRAKEGA